MESKKISFGFSKLAKKVNLQPAAGTSHKEAEKIEMISCLEDQAIKIVGKENGDDEPPPLVIPLRDQDKTTIPGRLAKLQEIQEEKGVKIVSAVKQEKVDPSETLEQKAAREIMEDLKGHQESASAKDNFVVPLKPEELPLDGGAESTLDDYESVPIEKFGLAMLRGMGWKEDPNAPKKDDKFPEGPVQRPKGMGLGAERIVKSKNAQLIPPAKDEVLVMRKGALVKVLAGKHKDTYGTVESLDEHTSRVLVRFALGGRQESLEEYLLLLVSKAEFSKYSKVLNNAKYEEIKNRSAPSTAAPTVKQVIKREPSDSPSPPPSKPPSSRSDRNKPHNNRSRSYSRSPSREERRRRADRDQRRRSRSLEEPRSPPREDRRRKTDRDQRRRSRSPENRRSPARDERHRKTDRDQRRRSRSPERGRRDERRSQDSDSESSDERSRGRSSHQHKSSSGSYGRTSSGTKKKSHKYKQRRDHSRERAHSSDDDDRHHKKKTKKSKKQRSRSRSRR